MASAPGASGEPRASLTGSAARRPGRSWVRCSSTACAARAVRSCAPGGRPCGSRATTAVSVNSGNPKRSVAYCCWPAALPPCATRSSSGALPVAPRDGSANVAATAAAIHATGITARRLVSTHANARIVATGAAPRRPPANGPPGRARPERQMPTSYVHRNDMAGPDLDQDEVSGDSLGESARDSALRLVLASPLYRGATLALFLSGLGLLGRRAADRAVPGQGSRRLAHRRRAVLPHQPHRAGRRLPGRARAPTAPAAGWGCSGCAPSPGSPAGPPSRSRRSCGCRSSSARSSWASRAPRPRSCSPRSTTSSRSARHPGGDGVVAIVRMALTAGWVVGPVAGLVPRRADRAPGRCCSRPRSARSPRSCRSGRSRTDAAAAATRERRDRSARSHVPGCGRCCRCSRSRRCTCSSTPASRSSTRTCRST